MYPELNLSWAGWKAIQSGLSLTVYYIQEDVRYIPFLVDTTNKFTYRTDIDRTSPNTDLTDFETNFKAGGTEEDTIDEGIAEELTP